MADEPITQRELVRTLAMVLVEVVKVCSPSPEVATQHLYDFANAIDDLGKSTSHPRVTPILQDLAKALFGSEPSGI
jgi:hypothetical protein